MTDEQKLQTIETYQQKEGDTGYTEDQVDLLTKRISSLTEHLREHSHDYDTRRGLLKLVGQRRRLLRYLSKTNVDRYHKIISSLGLRR